MGLFGVDVRGFAGKKVSDLLNGVADGAKSFVNNWLDQIRDKGITPATIQEVINLRNKDLPRARAELAAQTDAEKRKVIEADIQSMEIQVEILRTDGVIFNYGGVKDAKHPALIEWERQNTYWLGQDFGTGNPGQKWTGQQILDDAAAQKAEAKAAEDLAKVRQGVAAAQKSANTEDVKAATAEKEAEGIARQAAAIRSGDVPSSVTDTLSNAGSSIAEKFVSASEAVGLGGPARGLVDLFKGAGGMVSNVFGGFSPGGKGLVWGAVGAIAAAVIGPRVLGMLPVAGGFFKNSLVAGLLAVAGLWFGFGGAQQTYLRNNPVDSSSPYSATRQVFANMPNPIPGIDNTLANGPGGNG